MIRFSKILQQTTFIALLAGSMGLMGVSPSAFADKGDKKGHYSKGKDHDKKQYDRKDRYKKYHDRKDRYKKYHDRKDRYKKYHDRKDRDKKYDGRYDKYKDRHKRYGKYKDRKDKYDGYKRRNQVCFPKENRNFELDRNYDGDKGDCLSARVRLPRNADELCVTVKETGDDVRIAGLYDYNFISCDKKGTQCYDVKNAHLRFKASGSDGCKISYTYY